MNCETIEGIGSIHGGEYEEIHVEGLGKLKGDATAGKVIVEGMFKSKGKLTAEEVTIDGMARVFRNLRTKRLVIDGMLKVRHANINAENIRCDGFLACTGEVLADDIRINGVSTVAKMYGDNIHISNHSGELQRNGKARLLKSLSILGWMYLGRTISIKYSLVDHVECTNLSASGLKAKTVRAGSVTLMDHCVVDKLYCDGEMRIDKSCRIGQIISVNQPCSNQQADWKTNNFEHKQKGSNTELSKTKQWGNEDMENSTFKKILDLYKNGKINTAEAERMLQSTKSTNLETIINETYDTPWVDDGKLRIVAFIGNRLLKKGEEHAKSIEVKFDGAALNVESYGNLTCGNVTGNASSGGGMHCSDVGGNVNCGGGLSCGDIGGNVNCGGGLTCKEISGAISAGGGVRIMK